MAATVSPAGGAPVLVQDLAAIETALAELWRTTSDPAAVGTASAVLRAATFNLVALVASEREGQAAASILADLTAHHPGRVLILCLDPDAAADELTAWVATHCRPIGDGLQVCGEQVMIVAGGRAVERVGSAVPALFLPDCPAIAWWRAGPESPALILDRLAPSLDALLLDGTRIGPAALAPWVAGVRDVRASLAVGDLAWERAEPWREWTADCFEPHDVRPDLRALGSVDVEYGSSGETVACLYLAWLAARLGWRPGQRLTRGPGGGVTGRLAAPAGDVAVTLRPGAAAAGIAGLRLETPGGLRCVLARQGPETVALRVTRGDEVVLRRVIRWPEPDEIALVGRWLERGRPDPGYDEALAVLAALCPSS